MVVLNCKKAKKGNSMRCTVVSGKVGKRGGKRRGRKRAKRTSHRRTRKGHGRKGIGCYSKCMAKNKGLVKGLARARCGSKCFKHKRISSSILAPEYR